MALIREVGREALERVKKETVVHAGPDDFDDWPVLDSRGSTLSGILSRRVELNGLRMVIIEPSLEPFGRHERAKILKHPVVDLREVSMN